MLPPLAQAGEQAALVYAGEPFRLAQTEELVEVERQRERRRRKSGRYAARAKAHGGSWERVDHHLVFLRDQFICYLCGEPTDWLCERFDGGEPTLDHVVPLIDGGDHTYGNCATAHRRCNQNKGAKHLTGPELATVRAYLAVLPDPRSWLPATNTHTPDQPQPTDADRNDGSQLELPLGASR